MTGQTKNRNCDWKRSHIAAFPLSIINSNFTNDIAPPRRASIESVLDLLLHENQSNQEGIPMKSTDVSQDHDLSRASREHSENLKFVLFVKILFHSLKHALPGEIKKPLSKDNRSSLMLERRVRQAVKYCIRKYRAGDAEFSSLIECLRRELLRVKKIDSPWQRAERFLNLYFSIRKQLEYENYPPLATAV